MVDEAVSETVTMEPIDHFYELLAKLARGVGRLRKEEAAWSRIDDSPGWC